MSESRKSNNQQKENKSEQKQHAVRNAAEWTTLIVSSVIVLFLIIYSIYHGVSAGKQVPRVDVSARTSDVVKLGNSYAVPVYVENNSSITAEDVRILVEVQREGKPEEREITINFLPEKGKFEGYVYFDFKPDSSKATAQVGSLQIP